MERFQPIFKPQIDLRALLRAARCHWPVIAGSVAVMAAFAMIYSSVATPRYTAEFSLLIDPGKSRVLAKRDSVSDHPMMDPGFVDSQTEVLQSDSVILSVVKSLNLAHDPAIFPPEGSWFPQFLSWILSGDDQQSSGPPSETRFEEAAVQAIAANLKIKRVRASNVIDVTYTAYSSEKAAQVANALAEGFMDAELDANYQVTRRAAKWLQERLKELRAEAAAADKAVQTFKSRNNIIDTARGLMSEQELSDVNTQLVLAKAETAQAKARLDRISAISQGDVVDGSVADALQSQIVTRLRAQYLDLSARAADLIFKYGPTHGAVLNLQHQMDELRRSMQGELHRIGQSAKSDYEIASAKEKSVQDSLDALVVQSHNSYQAQVELRDLESSAQTSRTIYESFLTKLQEATQQLTFPLTEARVISPAVVPERPSWPRKGLILLAAVVLGLAVGGGISTAREFFANNFRSSDDIVNIGIEPLGVLPEIGLKRTLRSMLGRILKDLRYQSAATQLARYSLTAPFSRFAETLRNVKVCIDAAHLRTRSCVVGITSSLPREGKSIFAANLALLTAQMGCKTLLIDGDLHRPSLTSMLFPDSREGLIEVLAYGVSLSHVIRNDPDTSLDFVPSVITTHYSNVVALLASPAMANLLADVRAQYKYVFIDLPPVVPIVDVKAITHLIDNFVVVIQWRQTGQKVVLDALASDEQLRERTLGAVLTRVDPAALKRIEAYKGRAYGNYYVDADVI